MDVTCCNEKDKKRSKRVGSTSCNVPTCDRAVEDVKKQPHFTREFDEDEIETDIKELLRNYAVVKDEDKLAIKLPDEGLFRFDDVSLSKDYLILHGINKNKRVRLCKLLPSDRKKLKLLAYL